MRKVLALSYMMGCSLALAVGKALPGIVAILLFSTAPAGVFSSFGLLGLGITGTLFGYFVSNQFPTSPPAISNWIMGL
jgi:hypothetical protein